MSVVFLAAGKAAWGHILSKRGLEDLRPAARWLEAIQDSAQVVLVSENESGTVVGLAVLRASEDEGAEAGTGELDSFYTHPSVWGMGVGRDLLKAAVKDFTAMGFARVTLWTAEDNHRPRRVYEAAGWTPDGTSRTRTHLGATFVELRYALSLGKHP